MGTLLYEVRFVALSLTPLQKKKKTRNWILR
jgi:hypothetical protein